MKTTNAVLVSTMISDEAGHGGTCRDVPRGAFCPTTYRQPVGALYIASGTLSASFWGPVVPTDTLHNLSFAVSPGAGNFTGSIQIYASNDPCPIPVLSSSLPKNWAQVSTSTFAGSAPISGTTDTIFFNLYEQSARFFQLRYTHLSGQGGDGFLVTYQAKIEQ